jgi:uridine kinase
MNVILISGPSCSGKSTLATRLATKLDANLLSLDLFYKLGSEKIYVKQGGKEYRTFERKELYDGEKVAQLITTLQQQRNVEYHSLLQPSDKTYCLQHLKRKPSLIVEGFHALNYPSLTALTTYTLYLDLPFEKQVFRRKQRSGRPASDTTFEKVGEQEYENYILPQKEKAELVLDANATITSLLEKSIDYIS